MVTNTMFWDHDLTWKIETLVKILFSLIIILFNMMKVLVIVFLKKLRDIGRKTPVLESLFNKAVGLKVRGIERNKLPYIFIPIVFNFNS